jgi:phosphatidylglycerol:prolipoprotein diacylglycerol transferase
MLPFLDLKFIQLPMYGICIASAVIFAGVISWFLIKYEKKCFWDFLIQATLVLAFGFIFAKILFVLVSVPLKSVIPFLINNLIHPKESQIGAGFVFYGGILGGILGMFLGAKIAKIRVGEFLNIFSIITPFVHAFGRLGCFCAGCCYGIPYDGLCAIKYSNPLSSAPINVPLFPVQLLESLLLFFLFVILLILFIKKIKPLWAIYLCSYFVLRFFLEYLRYDYERGFLFSFSTSQIISICGVIFVPILLLILNRLKNKTE